MPDGLRILGKLGGYNAYPLEIAYFDFLGAENSGMKGYGLSIK